MPPRAHPRHAQMQMQGFIHKRGQNRQSRAPANRIIQVQRLKNTGKIGNTERVTMETRNKEMAIQ